MGSFILKLDMYTGALLVSALYIAACEGSLLSSVFGQWLDILTLLYIFNTTLQANKEKGKINQWI